MNSASRGSVTLDRMMITTRLNSKGRSTSSRTPCAMDASMLISFLIPGHALAKNEDHRTRLLRRTLLTRQAAGRAELPTLHGRACDCVKDRWSQRLGRNRDGVRQRSGPRDDFAKSRIGISALDRSPVRPPGGRGTRSGRLEVALDLRPK